MEQQGSVALITGASAGIGAALARELARQGHDLVLAARRLERLEALAEEVRSLGRQALAVSCDVTAGGDLEAAVAAALETFGRLDLVVANAGFGVGGPLEKLTLADYRRQLETNVFGVLRTVFASREALMASRGCLAIIGSVTSYLALPGNSPYAMSKHAVKALASSLDVELRPHGVAVCLIAPGFVDSEIRQVDNSGTFRPEWHDNVPRWLRMPAPKAARKIVRAIRRRRRVAVITGHGKLAVWLERHVPWLVSAIIRRQGRKLRRKH